MVKYNDKILGIKRFYDSHNNPKFKYIGEFNENTPNGRGIMIFSDRFEVYLGEFPNKIFKDSVEKKCSCCNH